MFQDKVNNPLTIGDQVAYAVGGQSTRLGLGVIISFSPKRVRVQYPNGTHGDHQPDRLVKVSYA